MQDETITARQAQAVPTVNVRELAGTVYRRCRVPFVASFLTGIVVLAATFLVPPTFTARTTFLPPQQQSSAATALASLGALSAIVGANANLKSPVDQYVALLQSETVTNRLVDQFQLMEVYHVKLRADARKAP